MGEKKVKMIPLDLVVDLVTNMAYATDWSCSSTAHVRQSILKTLKRPEAEIRAEVEGIIASRRRCDC